MERHFTSTIRKTLRYIIAGGIGAGANFAIYFVLVKYFNIWYLAASVSSFVLSLVAGFYLQKYFTFRNTNKDAVHKQVLGFFIFSLINLGVEILNIDKILAKVLTLAILAIWSYFVYQKYIFRN
jgi:putative flippase GtrA